MIELNERLSEFSYGYGVTRAAENCLSSVGLKTVPFLPSLLDEKPVGFDVGFKRPGAPLLLQFKLGQSLQRFRRSSKKDPIPPLSKPFWRFRIDTAEPDGQFETLLKAQRDGAEVYYAAPKFSDWETYREVFEKDAVLEQSLLVTPEEIGLRLAAKGIPDGVHRVVYDQSLTLVCSEPIRIASVPSEDLRMKMRVKIEHERTTLGERVANVYAGLDNRAAVRRREPEKEHVAELHEARQAYPGTGRAQHLKRIMERAKSPDDATAAALGFEVWTLGIQLLLVGLPE